MIRGRPRLTRREMLESIPHVNPAVQWRELDTGALLAVYEKAAGDSRKALRRLLVAPETAELALDAIGAKIIRQMDGTKTVWDLIAYVAQECKVGRKEAEVALLKYMDMLGRRNLVGFEPPTSVEEP